MCHIDLHSSLTEQSSNSAISRPGTHSLSRVESTLWYISVPQLSVCVVNIRHYSDISCLAIARFTISQYSDIWASCVQIFQVFSLIANARNPHTLPSCMQTEMSLLTLVHNSVFCPYVCKLPAFSHFTLVRNPVCCLLCPPEISLLTLVHNATFCPLVCKLPESLLLTLVHNAYCFVLLYANFPRFHF